MNILKKKLTLTLNFGKFCKFSESFISFLGILSNFGAFWESVGSFGELRGVFGNIWEFWKFLGSFGEFWVFFSLFCILCIVRFQVGLLVVLVFDL
jgi:hypothetical protein